MEVLANAHQPPVQSKKMGDTPISGWAALAAVIAVIVLFVKIGSAGKDGNDHPSSAHDESVMAFEQCKDFVKGRLKAPGTADFGEYWDSHVMQVTDPDARLEDVTYQVVSYVDAQNSFGAKLRNKFTCTERWNGQDDADIRNWTLKDLQMHE